MEFNPQYVQFLEVWKTWTFYLAIIFLAAGILISLYYFAKLVSISDPKTKHDFINDNEIKLFWYSMLALTIGVGIWLNGTFNETVKEEMIWFGVRFRVAVLAARRTPTRAALQRLRNSTAGVQTTAVNLA